MDLSRIIQVIDLESQKAVFDFNDTLVPQINDTLVYKSVQYEVISRQFLAGRFGRPVQLMCKVVHTDYVPIGC